MSLFRKPKKQISRRVFSAEDDAIRMEADDDDNTSSKSQSEKRKDKKTSKSNKVTSKNQLLSFDDEEGRFCWPTLRGHRPICGILGSRNSLLSGYP
jgi:hypothetical protein